VTPYFPEYFRFIVHHFGDKLLPGDESVRVGREWFPYDPASLLANALPAMCYVAFGASVLAERGGGDRERQPSLADPGRGEHGDDRHEQQREPVVEPRVDAAETGKRPEPLAQPEVEADEQARERQRLHPGHVDAEEKIGRRRGEREQGERDEPDAVTAQEPDERRDEGRRPGDGRELTADAEIAERERHQPYVKEHVVIRVLIRRENRERQPREPRREPAHAAVTDHLRVADVEVRVVADQVRRRELQPREHDDGGAQRDDDVTTSFESIGCLIRRQRGARIHFACRRRSAVPRPINESSRRCAPTVPTDPRRPTTSR